MSLGLCIFVTLLIFLNGATDAANSIATAVSSGALTLRRGAVLSAFWNLVGGLSAGTLFGGVGRAVEESADFGRYGQEGALCALVATVLFTGVMWLFHLPTSESHALLSAIAGVGAALGGGGFLKVLLPALIWMSLCTAGGFLVGAVFAPRRLSRLSPRRLCRCQVLFCAVSSFFHGVQDLPKFLALLTVSGNFNAEWFVWAGAAFVMGLGTLFGGRRMTEAVGAELATLTPKAALSADVAAAAVMLVMSACGLPASTTHGKTAAVAAVSLRATGCTLHRKQFCRFAIAWVATFPVAAGLSYLLCRLFFPFL